MTKSIKLHDKSFVPFIDNGRIEAAIDALALRLNSDFEYAEEPPILLCVLNGAMLFTAELMKRLDFPLELASVKLSSYVGTQSTGEVKEEMAITAPIKDRTVIVCEDIVDTGATIGALKRRLEEMGAKDVKICTLLLKPEVFQDRVKLDYVGIEIPNSFIVGFGLDYDELGRNLSDIYVIEQ